jgi:hypothetical protein
MHRAWVRPDERSLGHRDDSEHGSVELHSVCSAFEPTRNTVGTLAAAVRANAHPSFSVSACVIVIEAQLTGAGASSASAS